jgi:hypothetical protein
MPAGSAARQAKASMTTARAPRLLPILRGTWTEEARTRGMLPRGGCFLVSAVALFSYSISSSAISRKSRRTARPSVFAVLRFITNSNFVGCWMGNSAGFAPLRTWSK